MTRSGWGYAYTAPADMLVARSIFAGKREPGQDQDVPFTKELNDAGTGFLLLTDMTAAELIYTTADATKLYMGLPTWKHAPGGKILKSDVTIAKNRNLIIKVISPVDPILPPTQQSAAWLAYDTTAYPAIVLVPKA